MVIAVPKAELWELCKLLRMPEVGLEPTLPEGNWILSHRKYPLRGPAWPLVPERLPAAIQPM